MSEPLMMTMDFGTQSVRVALFNKKGEVVAMEKEKYDPPYFSTQSGYAEQDPVLYYNALCECTKRLKPFVDSHKDDIKGVALTCFRDTAVLLDKDNQVIRPSILWLDQRAAKCEKKLPLVSRALFKLVGMAPTIEFNRERAMANWIQENEPVNWARCAHYLPISTYFIFRLTGEMKDASSNMAGHYPLDFKKRQWYKNAEKHLKGQIFGLKNELLPTIVPEGSLIGEITEEASKESGLPVGLKMYACGSDKSCETLGLGIVDDTVGAISCGTAATIETTRDRYTESEPFLPGYPSVLPGYYNMDVQIYRGYWMINWFAKEFGGEKIEDLMSAEVDVAEFNRHLAAVPPGSEGLTLQPYWGPGLARPLAKGAIIGFSDSTTKWHVYRAIIEGIGYALREGLEHFEKKIHHGIGTLRISGGGSQSDEICQIYADLFRRPVSRVQTPETSSLGAAIAGFLAIKEFNDPKEAIDAMVQIHETFTPKLGNADAYDYLFNEVYLKMFPSLDKSYRSIKRWNRLQANGPKK